MARDVQRRHALVSAAGVISGLAGCMGAFASDGSLTELNVELRNGNGRARTFHLGLETESGMLEWESYHIAAGVNERVSITPDEDISPVALHGAAGDFVGSVDILGVTNLDDDYCLRFQFVYVRSATEEPQIAQIADTEC